MQTVRDISVTNTFITVTRKRFSSSSCIAPLIDPIAQHNYKVQTYTFPRIQKKINTTSPM